MTTGRFVTPEWPQVRVPSDDEDADLRRRAEYWEWNDANEFQDAAMAIMDVAPGVTWNLVGSAKQADFEAKHMRHSVGYDFDHYSKVGTIMSLREDGIPFVTVLVADDPSSDGWGIGANRGRGIVHAVRAGNAPITERDRAILQGISERAGWGTLPDTGTLRGACPDAA